MALNHSTPTGSTSLLRDEKCAVAQHATVTNEALTMTQGIYASLPMLLIEDRPSATTTGSNEDIGSRFIGRHTYLSKRYGPSDNKDQIGCNNPSKSFHLTAFWKVEDCNTVF